MTVYIYSRLSHEEQFNNGISLDTQEDRCRKYIELNELKMKTVTGVAVRSSNQIVQSKTHNSWFDQYKGFVRQIVTRLSTFVSFGILIFSQQEIICRSNQYNLSSNVFNLKISCLIFIFQGIIYLGLVWHISVKYVLFPFFTFYPNSSTKQLHVCF